MSAQITMLIALETAALMKLAHIHVNVKVGWSILGLISICLPEENVLVSASHKENASITCRQYLPCLLVLPILTGPKSQYGLSAS